MFERVPEDLRLTVGCTYHMIVDCPMGTCNKKSFKAAQVWGLTEDACLGRLRRHYTNSELHWNDFCDDEDRDNQVQNARCCVVEEVATQEDVDQQGRHFESAKKERADGADKKAAAQQGGGKGLQKIVNEMQAQLCKLTEAVNMQAMSEMKMILTFFKRSVNRWKCVSNSGPSTAEAFFLTAVVLPLKQVKQRYSTARPFSRCRDHRGRRFRTQGEWYLVLDDGQALALAEGLALAVARSLARRPSRRAWSEPDGAAPQGFARESSRLDGAVQGRGGPLEEHERGGRRSLPA